MKMGPLESMESTFDSKQDPMHSGIQKQGNSSGFGILQKISSSVPEAILVKDGAPYFSPINMVISEAIIRHHTYLY